MASKLLNSDTKATTNSGLDSIEEEKGLHEEGFDGIREESESGESDSDDGSGH